MDLTSASLRDLPRTVATDVRDLFRVATWTALLSGKGSIWDMGERYPLVRRDGSSTIDGVFLAGNIAGHPDIKAALNTGVTAAESVARRVERLGSIADGPVVVIVGGGPAGVAAALELERRGVSYVLLERGKQLFATVRSFKPDLDLYLAKTGERRVRSPLGFADSTTRETLASWEKVLAATTVRAETGVEVASVRREGERVVVRVKDGRALRAHAAIVAVGKLVYLDKLAVREARGLDRDPEPAERVAGAEGVPLVGKENVERTAFDERGLLREVPLRYERDFTLRRSLFLVAWAVFVLWLYLAKAGLVFSDPVAHATAFLREPATAAQAELAHRWHDAVTFAGWEGPWLWLRNLSLGSLYPLVYSIVVLVFGIRALRRWNDALQRKKYALLIFTQGFFYFFLPELVLRPLLGDNYWFGYTIAYPWPLLVSPKTVGYFHPSTELPSSFAAFVHSGNFYLLWAFVLSFVLLPVAVLFTGKRFCSWMCGCGGLAETLGDEWRQFRPAGAANRHRERQIYYALAIVFVLSVVTALAATFGRPGSSFWRAGDWIRASYAVSFDLLAVSIIPVALYPVLGGKIWCRYWCPTAGFMHLLSALFRKKDASRFAIVPRKERCIACDFCTRYCEVGIDVRSFALKGKVLDNLNSSCIGCGLCVTVCPTDVLRFDDPRGLVSLLPSPKATTGPRPATS